MSQYGTARYGMNTYGPNATAVEHPYLLTAGKVIWKFQVDWNNDGNFGTEIEPQTITALSWRRGRRNRIRTDGTGQEHPEQETFTIKVLDQSARYDMFNMSSPIYNYLQFCGMPVRIFAMSTTSKATEPVFYGMLASVTYDAHTQVATLIGEGLARWLQTGEAESMYTPCNGLGYDDYDYSPYFIIGSTPTPVNWWSGKPEGLYIRECARLTLEECGWPFGMVSSVTDYNDDYPDYFYLAGESAWNSIKELADAFAAKLFFRRDGRLFVMDRQDTVTGLTVNETPISGALEKYGLERITPHETLRNHVEVLMRPHAVMPFHGVPPTWPGDYVLFWENAGPIAVPNGGMTINVEFEYGGNPAQGAYLQDDGLDEAWDHEDRTGTDLKALGMAGVQQAYSNIYTDGNQQRGVIVFNNSSGVTAYVFDVKIYLCGIYQPGQPITITGTDAASIALNRTKKLRIDRRWVQRKGVADNIVNAYLAQLASRARAGMATLAYALQGDSLFDALTTKDLGSFIDFGAIGGAMAQANYGMNGRWLIAGETIEWMSADGQAVIVKKTHEKTAFTQVALSGSVSTGTGSAAVSVTWSHTVPAGNYRLLVVQVGLRASNTVTGVTFGGVALTKLASAQYASGNYARGEIWYLVAPAASTANVVVSLSGAEQVEAAALNFVNVHQTAPFQPYTTGSGLGGSSASLSPQAIEGDLVLDMLIKEGGTLTPDATQTSQWAETADGNWKGGGSTETGGSPTVNMSWELTGANAWVQLAAAIRSYSN